MFPKIVLEGVDASGKSSVGLLLAKRIGGTYLKTPMAPYSEWRSSVDAANDLIARFYFYLASVVAASPIVENEAKKGPVVIDRWILSTIANHEAMGVNTSVVDFAQLPILRPTHTFLLTVDCATQQNRFDQRVSTSDSNLERDQALQRRALQEFRKFNLPEIDTTNRKPEESTSLILELIGKE